MSLLQEEHFTLPTSDGKTIYGILTRSPKPMNKVIILAHGLTGSMHEHIHIKAREFFANHGYDVVRFDFYGAAKDARVLHETTLQDHAADINTVCDHFRPSYKKLFCAGHSYGGLSLLIANPEATAFSFWDSTFIPFDLHWKNRTKLEGTPYYKAEWGVAILIGEAMYEEARSLTRDTVHNYTHKIKAPSQVVLAGDNIENEPREELYTTLICEKSLEDIEGADHRFLTNNTLDTLLTKTLAWFDAH